MGSYKNLEFFLLSSPVFQVFFFLDVVVSFLSRRFTEMIVISTLSLRIAFRPVSITILGVSRTSRDSVSLWRSVCVEKGIALDVARKLESRGVIAEGGKKKETLPRSGGELKPFTDIHSEILSLEGKNLGVDRETEACITTPLLDRKYWKNKANLKPGWRFAK